MATATDKEEVLAALLPVVQLIIANGEANHEELLELVGNKGLLSKALEKGTRAKAITRIAVQTDAGPEPRYKLMNADRYRGKAPDAILEEVFALVQQKAPKYSHYVSFECHLVLERPSLGADPGANKGELVWPRLSLNGHSAIWLRPWSFAAWLRQGAAYAECSQDLQAALHWKKIWFEDVLLEGVETERHTIISPATIRGGTGVMVVEALPIGTRIPIRFQYPSTTVRPEELVVALQAAATMVGFSASRHYDGWGRGRIEFDSA